MSCAQCLYKPMGICMCQSRRLLLLRHNPGIRSFLSLDNMEKVEHAFIYHSLFFLRSTVPSHPPPQHTSNMPNEAKWPYITPHCSVLVLLKGEFLNFFVRSHGGHCKGLAGCGQWPVAILLMSTSVDLTTQCFLTPQ